MTRSRRIVAVLAVSMALCADSVASAAPTPKMPVAEMAARLVLRLSESFSYAAAGESRVETRHAAPPQAVVPTRRFAPASEPTPQHVALSPFQFRLPPPLI